MFFVAFPIREPWLHGDRRTVFVYSIFAAAAGPRIKCQPFWAGNLGILCEAVENQRQLERGRIKLTLVNQGPDLPGSEFSYIFGLQVGP